MASSSEDNDLVTFSERMLSLPTEILLMICDHLPPSILSEFEHSGFDKIREISKLSKIADFRLCPTISEETALNYISSRRRKLTELYVDDMVFVNSGHLSKAVMTCKQLRVLSLRHAGISLTDVVKIFEKLTNVVDFSWSTDPDSELVYNVVTTSCHWTKLTLDIHNIDQFVNFFSVFSHQMRKVIRLEFNFYVLRPYSKLQDVANFFQSFTYVPELESFKVTCPSMPLCYEIPRKQCIGDYSTAVLTGMQFITIQGNKDAWRTFWVPFLCTNSKEYISFSSGASKANFTDINPIHILEKYNRLDADKNNSFESFGISCKVFDTPQASFLTKYGGSNLKSLVFRNNLNHPCIIKDFNLLESMLINCVNITHFDGRGIHRACEKPNMLCEALCGLTYLKKLSLSVCAIKKIIHPATRQSNGSITPEIQEPCPFEKMISCCPLVEEFILSGCKFQGFPTCTDSFSDQALNNLYQWNSLKSLRLELVENIRLCSFLINVGKYCKRFQSLELIGVGCQSVFHFTPSLSSLFKNSSSLRSIKLVHKAFNVNDKLFWDGLSFASGLKLICFTTKVHLNLNTSVLTSCIKKLEKLHSFHLRCNPEPSRSLRSKLNAILTSRMGKQKVVADLIIENSTNKECDYIDEPACPRLVCCRNMIV